MICQICVPTWFITLNNNAPSTKNLGVMHLDGSLLNNFFWEGDWSHYSGLRYVHQQQSHSLWHPREQLLKKHKQSLIDYTLIAQSKAKSVLTIALFVETKTYERKLFWESNMFVCNSLTLTFQKDAKVSSKNLKQVCKAIFPSSVELRAPFHASACHVPQWTSSEKNYDQEKLRKNLVKKEAASLL